MRRSASVAALRMLLLATPLHASLIAPSVQLRGAPAHSAAATPRRGAGSLCMRAIGVDSEASLDGLDSLDEDAGVLLTGDPAADAMIRLKMGVPVPKKSQLVAKKPRREDMVEAKGHRVGERMSGGAARVRGGDRAQHARVEGRGGRRALEQRDRCARAAHARPDGGARRDAARPAPGGRQVRGAQAAG